MHADAARARYPIEDLSTGGRCSASRDKGTVVQTMHAARARNRATHLAQLSRKVQRCREDVQEPLRRRAARHPGAWRCCTTATGVCKLATPPALYYTLNALSDVELLIDTALLIHLLLAVP